eukprot:TRINITY_DN10625_c0_g1_i1.p1 TRINITY_DN10625_c0_g1~~TRINITY_DN10625_c0_g1_i1.p1  ORF type:complete len:129 (-),score=16.30 TRINITY_DN10625_c0_g1_i1:170-556(-)
MKKEAKSMGNVYHKRTLGSTPNIKNNGRVSKNNDFPTFDEGLEIKTSSYTPPPNQMLLALNQRSISIKNIKEKGGEEKKKKKGKNARVIPFKDRARITSSQNTWAYIQTFPPAHPLSFLQKKQTHRVC